MINISSAARWAACITLKVMDAYKTALKDAGKGGLFQDEGGFNASPPLEF